MIELAKQADNNPVPLRVLAKTQNISTKYLEQMVSALKIGGLIESVRGAEGGYRLARLANKITVWDIYNVLDISVDPIDCLHHPCSRDCCCVAQELWSELSDSITTILKSYNLHQLAKRELSLLKKRRGKK
jgi:Rrf2 family transcriptional regulator, cysteine metabolism repressor